MIKRHTLFITLISLVIFNCLHLESKAQYEFAEDGFTRELITDELNYATGITFDPNGQGYIWTKDGKVYIMTTDGEILPDPILDISEEVGNYWDHGLLGFALDPQFTENGFFYLAYKVERNYLINFGSPDYDPTHTIDNAASIGRVARYTADITNNFHSVDLDSRLILLGAEIDNGVPLLHDSHGMGMLAFGSDGTLLVGTGDGSTFNGVYTGGGPPYYDEYVESALADNIIPPEQEVGAYRAQQVQSYNGKILRIDPSTGEGLPSNPFYDADDPQSAKSKVWSLGLRNPFRFRVKQGTGESDPSAGNPGVIFVGDVGYSHREELNLVNGPGQNFGWPHFEGIFHSSNHVDAQARNLYAANPLAEETGCNTDHFLFDDLVIQNHLSPQSFLNPCDNSAEIEYPYLFEHSLPVVAYEHVWDNANGVGFIVDYNDQGEPTALSIADPESGIEHPEMRGSACIGGDFYTGETFPQEYHELYFVADYHGWIKAFEVSPDGELLFVKNFLSVENVAGANINHLEFNPHDDSFYLMESGKIFRIYYGEDESPKAQIAASETFGPSPLNLHFDGSESYSPLDDSLSFLWTIGDESYTEESFDVELTASSTSPEEIPVSLVVTDDEGRTDSTSVSISLNNTPPKVQIATFSDDEFYPIDLPSGIPLTAYLSDAEESNSELSVKWTSHLHHNTHYHVGSTDINHSSTFNLSTIGCGDQQYYYRIQLDVEDSYGLKTTRNLELAPYCGAEAVPVFANFTHEASPGGPQLKWSTSHPENIDKVIVLRGENQYDLFPIDTVEVNGNPAENSYIDFSPPGLANHYALKLMTAKNVFRFSTVKKVVNEAVTGDFLVFPNPSDNTLTVFSRHVQGFYVLSVYSARGKQIREFSGISEEHINLQLPTSNLADGLYMIQLKTNDFTALQKFLVAHP